MFPVAAEKNETINYIVKSNSSSSWTKIKKPFFSEAQFIWFHWSDSIFIICNSGRNHQCIVQCSMFNWIIYRCAVYRADSVKFLSQPIVGSVFENGIPFKAGKYRKLDCIVCTLWKLKSFATFASTSRGLSFPEKPTLSNEYCESNWIHHIHNGNQEATWKGINDCGSVFNSHCYLSTFQYIRFQLCNCSSLLFLSIYLFRRKIVASMQTTTFSLFAIGFIHILHLFITLSLETAYSCMFVYSFLRSFIRMLHQKIIIQQNSIRRCSQPKSVWPWQYVFLSLFFDTFRRCPNDSIIVYFQHWGDSRFVLISYV